MIFTQKQGGDLNNWDCLAYVIALVVVVDIVIFIVMF